MWGHGTVLGGRYALTERLGSGAMGEVWKAEDRVLERRVAVKIVLPALLADEVFAARFRREARMLAALNHRGVVDIHDYGEESDESAGKLAYIVMELLDGRPLDRVREESGKLPADQALDIVAQVLDAVHAAHQQGIVHRDIKPSNLMLAGDGQVTVTDFGIARSLAGTKLTSSDTVIGTSLYLAPERAEGREAVPSSDLYSIGVVCYELLTGAPPFTGETALEIILKHVREPVPPLPDELPEPVHAVIATALAKQPDDRFADAAEMAVAVREAMTAPWRSAAAGGLPVDTVPTAALRVRAGRPAAGAGAGAAGAAAAASAGSAVVAPVESVAATGPGARAERRRRPLVVAVVVPLVVTTGVVLGERIERLPWEAHAKEPGTSTVTAPVVPGAVVTVPPTAADGSGAAPTTGQAPVPTPVVTAPAPGEAPPAAGVPLPPPGGAAPPAPNTGTVGGGGSVTGGSGGSTGGGTTGTSGGSGGGGSASGGSTSGGAASGSTGTGGGSAPVPAPTQAPAPPPQTQNPPPQTQNPPPPQTPTPPDGCGGSGWGALVNVGSGMAVGLAQDSPSAGVAVVMGGHTQYGWVRKADVVQPIATIHPCNTTYPGLGVQVGGATGAEIASPYGHATSWTLTEAGPGTFYLKFTYGYGSCLTDNGAGRQLTLTSCVPGSKTQIWRFA